MSNFGPAAGTLGMEVSASTQDRGQFLRLFLAAERDIFRYLSAMLPHPQDARDVLQETALALREEFDGYDATRPFLPWAIGFALNKARLTCVDVTSSPHSSWTTAVTFLVLTPWTYISAMARIIARSRRASSWSAGSADRSRQRGPSGSSA